MGSVLMLKMITEVAGVAIGTFAEHLAMEHISLCMERCRRKKVKSNEREH